LTKANFDQLRQIATPSIKNWTALQQNTVKLAESQRRTNSRSPPLPSSAALSSSSTTSCSTLWSLVLL